MNVIRENTELTHQQNVLLQSAIIHTARQLRTTALNDRIDVFADDQALTNENNPSKKNLPRFVVFFGGRERLQGI